MPLLKKPGASRLLPSVSSTPSQDSSPGPKSGDEGKESLDNDTTSKPKGWLVAIAKDDNSNGCGDGSLDNVLEESCLATSQSSLSLSQEPRRTSQGWLLARAEEQERISQSQKSSDSSSQSSDRDQGTSASKIPLSKSQPKPGEPGWLVSFAKSLDNPTQTSSSSGDGQGRRLSLSSSQPKESTDQIRRLSLSLSQPKDSMDQSRRLSFTSSQPKDSSQAPSSSSRGGSLNNKRDSLSSFELLASQEILSQVSNLGQFEKEKNEEAVVESISMPKEPVKSKKRYKDLLNDQKDAAPKTKKSKKASNISPKSSDVIEDNGTESSEIQSKPKSKKSKSKCPPKTNGQKSTDLDVNKILLSLEPLPKESLESQAASSSSVEPVTVTQDVSSEAVTRDVSELVEVLLSQVVENSGSDQIISDSVVKKTKAAKKKTKKDVLEVDYDDYYVETGVVDLPPENDQQSDLRFSVPMPKKRKIAKKPKSVNLKVNLI